MLLYGFLQSLCKVKYFTHCHLREIILEYFVEYIVEFADICFDNFIGLGLIIKGVGNSRNSPSHYLIWEFQRIEKEKEKKLENLSFIVTQFHTHNYT